MRLSQGRMLGRAMALAKEPSWERAFGVEGGQSGWSGGSEGKIGGDSSNR